MRVEIRPYESVEAFVDQCQSALMRDECKNNVILGTCQRFRHEPIDLTKYHFVAAFAENDTIVSCALTTPTKTFIAIFIDQIDVAVKPLADYFHRQQSDLQGVGGEMTTIRRFLDFYPRAILQSKTLLLHALDTLQSIELVPDTELSLATPDDLSLLTRYGCFP